MDLSSLNQSLNILSNKIKNYLDNKPSIEGADFEHQQDAQYIANQYNNIVQLYSNLLDLITEIQYFISQCKKLIKLISDNTSLEKNQKLRIKTAIEIITELSEPLYNEKEKLKTLEMFYRNIYSRRDF